MLHCVGWSWTNFACHDLAGRSAMTEDCAHSWSFCARDELVWRTSSLTDYDLSTYQNKQTNKRLFLPFSVQGLGFRAWMDEKKWAARKYRQFLHEENQVRIRFCQSGEVFCLRFSFFRLAVWIETDNFFVFSNYFFAAVLIEKFRKVLRIMRTF